MSIYNPITATPLADADVTVDPNADVASEYVCPSGTLSTNRTVTLDATSLADKYVVRVILESGNPSGNLIVKNTSGTTLATLSGGGPPQTASFYVSSALFLLLSTYAAAVIDSATTSKPGLMPASNFAKLADLDYDHWFQNSVDIMKADATALTNYREIPIVGNNTLPANSVDAVVVGGAIQNGSGYAKLTGPSVYQTMATTSWAFAFRMKMQVSTAGHFNFIGFTNVSGSHDFGFASYSPDSTTKYLLYNYNGAETFVASSLSVDGAWHNVVMTFNGTTQKLYIDGTLEATQAVLTSLTDEATWPTIFGNISGDVIVSRFAYGYIVP